MGAAKNFTLVVATWLCICLLGTTHGQQNLLPYSPFSATSFEPSAVAIFEGDGNGIGSRVLVLSDKDPIIYKFEFYFKGGKAELLPSPARQPNREIRVKNQDGNDIDVFKFESIQSLNKNLKGKQLYIAATAFDDKNPSENKAPVPALSQVIKFEFQPDKAIYATALTGVGNATDIRTLIANIIKEKNNIAGQPWFKIEGLAVDSKNQQIFFGIRQIGSSEIESKNVIDIVRCNIDIENNKIDKPNAYFKLSSVEANPNKPLGLSDIQRDPRDNSYLILASYEGTDPKNICNHSGALFRIKPSVLESEPPQIIDDLGPPLRVFDAKSEGICFLPTGAKNGDLGLLVVVDDDREWKTNFLGYVPSVGIFKFISPAP